MNRKAMKTLAREKVQAAGKTPKLVTLIFLLCVVALTGLSYAPNLLDHFAGSSSAHLSKQLSIISFLSTFSYAFTLVLTIANTLLLAGYTTSALNILNHGKTAFSDLLQGARRPLRVILMDFLKSCYSLLWCYVGSLIPVSILLYFTLDANADYESALAVMDDPLITGSVIAIVLVLFFIVSYRYRMSIYLLMEHPELSAFQAIRVSVKITRGHRLQLFLLDLSFLPWYLLCILTCGILFIWKLPWIRATEVAACHSLIADYELRMKQSQPGFVPADYTGTKNLPPDHPV